MMQFIDADGKLELLSTSSFLNMVRAIETELPGWWWSVSQKKGELTISFGPTDRARTEKDILFSRTRRGDAGFIFKKDSWDDTQDSVYGCILTARGDRDEHMESHNDTSLVVVYPSYRYQNEEALKRLETEYESLSHWIKIGRTQEVYLGSCELSVDISIRGVFDDQTPFDYSTDLRDDAILADAIVEAGWEFILGLSPEARMEGERLSQRCHIQLE